MEQAITRKQHDTRPIRRVLQDQQTDGTWGPVDLSGSTVKFLMKDLDGAAIVNSPCTIVDEVAGIVEYNWIIGGGNDAAGTFQAEFEVTLGATVNTYPSDGYITVAIIPDLG